MTRKYISKIQDLPEPITFELDGTVYTCRELGPLELSEIARLQGEDADSPEAIAFMAEFFESLLGRKQYQEFKRACTNFNTPIETFVAIIEGVFEDFAARPSLLPSAYSDGEQNIEKKSTDGLSSRVMAQLDGRPDLQMAVKRTQEARQSP